MTWVTDPDGCSHCRYCAMDMDLDPYCVHPEVIKTHPWGLYLRNVRKPDGVCPDGKLFEPRERNV